MTCIAQFYGLITNATHVRSHIQRWWRSLIIPHQYVRCLHLPQSFGHILYCIIKIGTDQDEYYRRALHNRYFWEKGTQYPFWDLVYASLCQDTTKSQQAARQGIEGLRKLPLTPGKFWGIIKREKVIYAGTPFLSAYWMGRKHGLISELE